MISLHRSMHSSQMYTPGPAMSFFTCFCDLPQKEHFRRSESPNFAIPPAPSASVRARILEGPRWILGRLRRQRCKLGLHLAAGDDLIDDTVFLRLLGRHDE